MKTKFLVTASFGCALLAAIVNGAPLMETTAVHTKPDASSPAITYLKAGTEPNSVAASMPNTPAGWMAVSAPGPFSGYVEKKDLTKGLDVKPGTAIRVGPQTTAAVLATAEPGDKTTITGLQGKWAQISLEKNLVGYIKVGNAPGYLPSIATTPAGSAVVAPVTAPAPATVPAPAAPVASQAASVGQAVQSAAAFADSSSNLPRQFAGIFNSTRSAFRPRRPFDWELVDNAGKRITYLDISKLLLTEQLEKYVGHAVVVFGAVKPTADGKDIVIQVETLQLR